MMYSYIPTGRKEANPVSSRWNEELYPPITKYYIRCEAKCSFQIKNMCTFITGRCCREENEEYFFGQETRVIINMTEER